MRGGGGRDAHLVLSEVGDGLAGVELLGGDTVGDCDWCSLVLGLRGATGRAKDGSDMVRLEKRVPVANSQVRQACAYFIANIAPPR